MDLEALITTTRNDFNESSHRLRTLKNTLSGIVVEIAALSREPQSEGKDRLMEILLAHKRMYESLIEGRRALFVELYELAIRLDVDVDGSRLLKVYRFIFRNSTELLQQLALIDVPHESNAVWGIIILTAVMFLYAAV
ncbi:hypothetical protein CAEBREN_03754 [Caenorhabditis brenneri]|uniref:Uncharacterized protein n=1 Tax=Caenorhabditis brenneri TaxID=135651 RepID=G0MMZ1_CAEBE|nr:hypothetical protein CAEBREN_03754 [Caenorhabditis brenneri]